MIYPLILLQKNNLFQCLLIPDSFALSFSFGLKGLSLPNSPDPDLKENSA